MNQHIDFKKRMDIKNMLYNKFINDVVNKICKYGYEKVDKVKTERITRMMFDCMDFTEKDYMLALYGLIAPNASFYDFWNMMKKSIPEITNFFNADHGLKLFEGKWCMTEDGKEVKIIGYPTYTCSYTDGVGVYNCQTSSLIH